MSATTEIREGRVRAKWVGPFEAIASLEDGSRVVLTPGETILESVGYDEARDSAFWQPVDADGNDVELLPLPEPDPLSSLTVADLKALAAERGIEIPDGAKKADIIDLLEA